MTLKMAQAECKAMGVVLMPRNEWGEYTVRFAGKSVESEYYTDDLQDAVDTAHCMVAEEQDRAIHLRYLSEMMTLRGRASL